jgi:hypothetical protein
MDEETRAAGAAAVAAVVAAGLVLALLSALVPFFDAGYVLQYRVLLIGMLPYLVYGVAAPLLPRGLAMLSGVLLLAAHAWLVVGERFIDGADYSDGLILYVPLLLTLVLSPLLLLALRRPY